MPKETFRDLTKYLPDFLKPLGEREVVSGIQFIKKQLKSQGATFVRLRVGNSKYNVY